VNTICAGVPGGGSGFCAGEFGSPLVVGDQQVGIVSWAIGCVEAQHPGLYSNIATLKDFVTNQTGLQ
jgi:trypsin